MPFEASKNKKESIGMDILFIAHIVLMVGYALMVVGFLCH
jgi:hypothetical protein